MDVIFFLPDMVMFWYSLYVRNTSKKLFGLVCFALSFSLFVLIWMLSKQRAQAKNNQIKMYEIDVDHLSTVRRRNCALLLIKMDQMLLDGTDITNAKKLFRRFCFTLPEIDTKSSYEIQLGFLQLDWKAVEFDTMLDRIRYSLEGRSLTELEHVIGKVRQALVSKRFEDALVLMQTLPTYTMNTGVKKWINSLESLVNARELLRIGVTKLFSNKTHNMH